MKSRNANGQITRKHLTKFKEKFEANPANRLLLNAVTRGNLQEIAVNRDVLNQVDFCFSNELESGEVTDQKRAGTCWLFADLNWLRTITKKKINVKQFEFSENYHMFWDKLEKANYFLEKMIEYRDRDRDDRMVHFLLTKPVPDGGEWHMAENLINKYGIAPKSVMTDTFTRENTRHLNFVLGYKLRETAVKIRKAHADGKDVATLRRIKNKVMQDVYRILAIFMGVPPEKFDWSYKDEDKKFHRFEGITPKEFYDKFVGLKMEDVYTLWSSPSDTTPYDKTFTVDLFNNMVDYPDWKCLNVRNSELKKIAVKMLKNEDAVLFGCDVIQQSHTKDGILYDDVYDFEALFQTSFKMNKADRLDYGQSVMTHSMVFTGVDLVNGKPRKWKVENSWGDKVGKKGFFIMSDEWFTEHVYDLIVPKKYLTEKQLKLYEQDPIVLPPWHPMT